VVTANGWFAARPSGTEDVYKLYGESFLGADHLRKIQEEARALVARSSPPVDPSDKNGEGGGPPPSPAADPPGSPGGRRRLLSDLAFGLDPFVQDDDIHSTVLGLAGIGVVAGHGERLSIPDGGDPACLDPVLHQFGFHRIRSLPGKGQVVVVLPDAVRVPSISTFRFGFLIKNSARVATLLFAFADRSALPVANRTSRSSGRSPAPSAGPSDSQAPS